MKFSIITVCFNSEKTIEETLKSVSSQNYGNVEHIIIDGGSSDDTLGIVNNFKHVIKIISEKDEGIYDAMNKGINLAEGDVIGFLNSDDVFYNENVIKDYFDDFTKYETDIVYGDLIFTSLSGKKNIRKWHSSSYEVNKLGIGWIPPHPTFYAKKSLFESLGNFDTNFKFASDFDLMTRFLLSNNSVTRYSKGYKVKMRYGGATTKNLKNIYLGNLEIIRALKKNNIKREEFFLFKKFLNKIFQFFK